MRHPHNPQFDGLNVPECVADGAPAKFLHFADADSGAGQPEFLIGLVDLSNSMVIDDLKPSRKVVALAANGQLIKVKAERHPKDIVAIIGFGGEARLLHRRVVVGSNRDSLLQSLSDPDYMDWTNFHAALMLAQSVLFGYGGRTVWKATAGLAGFISNLITGGQPTAPEAYEAMAAEGCLRRIVMLSDGEQTQGPSPLPIAEGLKEMGVTIDCIGIGGRPENVDEAALKAIASTNPDGSPRYCFIKDRESLIRKYETLAGHIRVAER
jgi:hypothetical protein